MLSLTWSPEADTRGSRVPCVQSQGPEGKAEGTCRVLRRVSGGFRGGHFQGKSLERSRIGVPGRGGHGWGRFQIREAGDHFRAFEKGVQEPDKAGWKYKRRLRFSWLTWSPKGLGCLVGSLDLDLSDWDAWKGFEAGQQPGQRCRCREEEKEAGRNLSSVFTLGPNIPHCVTFYTFWYARGSQLPQRTAFLLPEGWVPSLLLPFPSCPDSAQWLQAWASDQADLDLDPGPTTYTVTEGKLLDLSELFALFIKWSCPQGTNKPAVCIVHMQCPAWSLTVWPFVFLLFYRHSHSKGRLNNIPPPTPKALLFMLGWLPGAGVGF